MDEPAATAGSAGTTWVLVADAARARLFCAGRDGFEELEGFSNTEARSDGRELLQDRPARVHDLVAPPRFLGRLKAALGKPLRTLLQGEIAKDLVSASAQDIGDALGRDRSSGSAPTVA